MSNRILTFCSVVTALTAFSVINISSADAQRTSPNRVTGSGDSTVRSTPRGLIRSASGGSDADANSNTSVKTNSNSNFTNNPTKIELQVSSSAQAGKVSGDGSTKSSLMGTGDRKSAIIDASNSSSATIDGARNASVSSSSGTKLDSVNGGSATGKFQFSTNPPATK